MSRRLTVLSSLAIALSIAPVALAAPPGYGHSEVVPAATLLLPYFEVDIGDDDGNGMGDCKGVNTLFSINNASASPTIAHVTLWSDWSVATLDFDIYLTGYDVQTINLCEVFAWGNLPITADDQNDPEDLISPHGGEFSNNPQWDGDGVGCADFFPFEQGILQGFFLDRIQNAHAGYEVPGFSGQCMGAGLNGAGQCSGGSCPAGTIARGYITVDQANVCSVLFAGEAGYFEDGGLGVAGNRNQLWGDYFIVDAANDFAQGEPLVHIEANDDLNVSQIPLTDTEGNTVATIGNPTGYTYYGRYTPGTGADNREPLGTVWGARYLNGTIGSTQWTVWRDSTQQITDHVLSYDCGVAFGAGPDWFPMNETQVVCFNEREDAVELCGIRGEISPISPQIDNFEDPACFPFETGRYNVGVDPLDTPFANGWCYLNLNPGIDGISNDVDFGSDGSLAQSYVTTFHSALGRYSVGHSAVQLQSALRDNGVSRSGDLDIGTNN